jgi:branched-subunit amino acid ABC-type transport system permease component
MEALVVQHLINWLVVGSIYTLIALGFSLLFGVLNVIHFSHGDVSIAAPFVALASVQALMPLAGSIGGTGGFALACLIAIVATGLIGVALDWLVIRRFRDAPAMMALVATVALGSVVRELIRSFYPQGSNPKPFPELIPGRIETGQLSIPIFSVFVIGVSALMVALLFVILRYTPLGTRIRAVAEDIAMARLMAIYPNRVFAATFMIASLIGGIGGIFYAGYVGAVRFDFGVQLGLIGFSAAVIGGLGSMQGAILGSLLISGTDALIQATIPDGASYRLVFAFVLVILVLVLRPSGLLGKPVMVKV